MIPQLKDDPWSHVEHRREAANDARFAPSPAAIPQQGWAALLGKAIALATAVVLTLLGLFFGGRWLWRFHGDALLALYAANRMELILGGLLMLCVALGAYMLKNTAEYRRTGRDFDSTFFDTHPGAHR